MSNDTLTREHPEAEVYKLAASVVEEPRQGGIAQAREAPRGGLDQRPTA